jgi:hypothetical protein
MPRAKVKPKHQRDYKVSDSREQDLEGLYELAKFVLESKSINLKYKKETLDWILWKVTEIDGKENTRYRSEQALITNEKINHEHVVTKRFLVEKLIEFPDMYKEILESAIACIVTEDEHKNKLSKVKNLEGWERYKNAEVDVIDMANGRKVNLEQLISQQKSILDKLNCK